MLSMAKTPDQVRSAFLYRMAKFIEFPNQHIATNTRFCFYSISQGPGAILSKAKSLKIRNLPISVQEIKKSSSLSELSEKCDITYFTDEEVTDSDINFKPSESLDMVTVSDNLEFLDQGGIASLVQEGSKIRLYINKKQVTQHNFKVLSRLLAVSKFHPN